MACIAWVPILRDSCRNLCTRNKKRSKDCVLAIKEQGRGPINPVEDIFYQVITNTLPPAKDWVRPQEQTLAIDKPRPLPDLPLDIIVTGIFTTLPAKCIFQLWQQTDPNDVLYDYFTINANFIRMHLDRGFRATTPTILIQSLTKSVGNVVKLFLSEDGTAENFKAATTLDLLGSCNNQYNCKAPFAEEQATLLGSCHGFLIFECLIHFSAVFRLWNPITEEQVILAPRRYTPVRVCGFYFHPLKKEYEVVFVHTSSRTRPTSDYQILGLRTKSRRSVGSCYYVPSIRKPAFVFTNGTLYWMVHSLMPGFEDAPSLSNSILSFNIYTEEIRTMELPCNRELRSWERLEEVFHLFEMEGHLCCFDSVSNENPMPKENRACIWEFNYDTKRWVTKYLMWPPKRGYWKILSGIEYIKMTGELITYVTGKRISYVYNLLSCRWKPFEKKGFEGHNFTVTTGHIGSLVSLDAGDSVIHIEW